MEFLLWLKDVAERAAVSFVVAVLAILGAQGWDEVFADGTLNISFLENLATAGLVAAAVVVKQATMPKSGFGLSPLVDAVYRTVWTGVQAGVAVILADISFDWFSVTGWQGVGIAVVASIGSAIKAFLAERFVANTVTPASLVAPPREHVVAAA